MFIYRNTVKFLIKGCLKAVEHKRFKAYLIKGFTYEIDFPLHTASDMNLVKLQDTMVTVLDKQTF